jgi:hypothetical protein
VFGALEPVLRVAKIDLFLSLLYEVLGFGFTPYSTAFQQLVSLQWMIAKTKTKKSILGQIFRPGMTSKRAKKKLSQ